MRPCLDDEDLVGVDDRRQAVGDDERRAALERDGERRLHVGLRRGVEVRRGLVEDHDARLGEQQPGDREALALAAGEPVAPLADHVSRPSGSERDEVVEAGLARARPTARRRSASGRAKRRFSRTVSWKRWPSWVTMPSVSRSESNVRSRTSTPPTRTAPAVDVVQARDQRGDRRLAAARRADEGDHLAGLGAERHAVEHLGARRAGRAWRPPRATPATPCRPTDRRSARRRARRSPAPAARSTASGRSVISGSRSSTSNTRSKLTSAVIASTRALASAVSGA